MVYGKTPFAHLGLIQKLQAIVNAKEPISFPSLPDPDLVNALQASLHRDPARRPSVRELMNHAFVVGRAASGLFFPSLV